MNLVSLISLAIKKTGLWSGHDGRGIHLFAKFSIFCFFATYVLQLITLAKAKGDSERLFECFSVLSFCGMGFLKLYSLRMNNKQWRSLLCQVTTLEKEQLNGDQATSNIEYHSDSEDEETSFSPYIESYTGKFETTSTILSRIYNFTGVIFILSPFVEYTVWKIIGSEYLEYPHILLGWAPLDSISIFGYIITILFEVVAATYCVLVHIAFDLTAVGLMIFVCGQFSLLRDYSELIGGKGNQFNISPERDNRAHCRIIKCHQTHVLLVNSITEIDRLMKDILGVYFFVVTLTLCSVAVRLKSEHMSTMQLISLLQYMCATLTQLFLFCCYGDAVMNKSSVNMGEGPFGAATWCLSPRIRRELCLLGMGMIRPRRLRAGPFNSLDLPSFIQIVRTAYSYYAVLGQKSN